MNFIIVVKDLMYNIDDGDKSESTAGFQLKLTDFVCLYISKCTEIS